MSHQLPPQPVPLDGVRVLEVSHTAAAATAGRILALLGADVWVEPSTSRPCGCCQVPDEACQSFMLGKRPLPDPDKSHDLPFHIVISDLDCCLGGDPSAQDRLQQYLSSGVIDVRVRTFDRASSHSHTAGTPLQAAAVSGVTVAVGRRDDKPLALPPGVVESATGVNAAAATLSAWFGRVDDEGCSVEVSMAGVLEHYVGINAKMFEGYPRRWLREGRRSSGSSGPYPAAIFQAKDGYVGLIGRSKQDWERLLAAMGDPSWADRPGYRDPWLIGESLADEVDVWVQEWVGQRPKDEIIRLAEEYGFITAPLRTIEEVLKEPQHHHRDFWSRDPDQHVIAPGLPFHTRAVTAPSEPRPSASSGRKEAQAAPSTLSLSPSRILQGIRVLDLSWVWAGPMASAILADLGAEVVKVEHPSRPDGSRARGRPSKNGATVAGPELEVTPYFHQVGHGKLSFGADITSPQAVEAIKRLARDCDVVLENMRPGVLERRGIGYSALSRENPELVMVSMSVAGQEGPLANIRGYAPVMSGLAGLESLVGYQPDDVTGMYTFALGDPNAAIYGVLAAVAGLTARERDGNGCWLDLSQLEAAITLLSFPITEQLRGNRPQPLGNADPRYQMQDTFCCRDGKWLALTVPGAAEHARLATFLAGAGAGTGTADDFDNREAGLHRILDRWVRLLPRDVAVHQLQEAGLAAAPVLEWEEEEHIRTRYVGHGSAVRVSHPHGGEERIFIPPWRINGIHPAYPRRSPLLGEHTKQIAKRLGMNLDLNAEAFHQAEYHPNSIQK